VASSGTALLLDGGHTAHSRFNIPLQVDQHSMCRIRPRSSTAQLIRMSKLIVWDEAFMVSRHAFDTVIRSFQDIMKMVDPELDTSHSEASDCLWRRFQASSPGLPRGTRAQIVDQCMNRSVFWRHVDDTVADNIQQKIRSAWKPKKELSEMEMNIVEQCIKLL
jgi:ATP-dependent DNA helicase PIF1